MIYPNYLIILIRKDKYYSFDNDKKILEYLNFKNKLYILRKNSINYLVLDELDIIEMYEYENNKLDKYLYLLYLDKILKMIITSCNYDLL